jgi:uncharacterized sporulation protein YeaH/YhbH (DUF444 family)
MHIVDRRLNPGSKSLENRQRFLRRAKALVQGAVKKSSEDRDIKDVLEGGEVSIPLDGMDEPRFRREGGTGDSFPETRSSSRATCFRVRAKAAARDPSPGKATARTTSCVYRKLKLGRSGGEVRQGSGVKR